MDRGGSDPARRTTVGDRLFVQTFDSNSKRLSNRRCTGRMLRPRKTLGRSADLKLHSTARRPPARRAARPSFLDFVVGRSPAPRPAAMLHYAAAHATRQSHNSATILPATAQCCSF
ncbi:hypothetical protein EVAR_102254_1 [Eumeta japonica]|uniref:Uncharacterized protein n=1 Tax=Eumeta variegata TaxID=151549 RepID=A0A4C1WDX0_EUMVA|nr:hypothetical protein EVAR_102254_1 [Eumeta japonica]